MPNQNQASTSSEQPSASFYSKKNNEEQGQSLIYIKEVASMQAAFSYAAENPSYYDINGQVLSVVGLKQADGGFKQTLVNHDLGGSTGLAKFWNGLGACLPEGEDKTKFNNNKQALLNISNQRHSIKDIHDIMFRVVWRLVNRLSNENLQFKKQEAFDQIYRDLYKYINQDIALFFNETDMSDDSATIIKKINTHIDEQSITYHNYVNHAAGKVFDQKKIDMVAREEGIANLGHKTAIDMDALESSRVTQLVIRSKGIEQSSESKKISPSATVPQQKYKFSEVLGDNAVDDPKPLRSQSRNPSFAHVRSLKEKVVIAGQTIKQEGDSFTVKEQVATYMARIITEREKAESNKPVVYNLLTSLSAHNSQAATAKDIFQAMHAYNKSAINNALKNQKSVVTGRDEPFLYVMNVPVNQWGDRLMLKPGWRGMITPMYNRLSKEAAFFADFAMLETLSENMRSEKINQVVINIRQIYCDFLTETEFADTSKQKGFFRNTFGPSINYFCDSKHWDDAVKKLEAAKGLVNKKAKEATQDQSADNTALDEQQKLHKAYAVLHGAAMGDEGFDDQKQYGSIIQGMFLAANDNDNLKGCKSAVDRYGFVENLGNCLLGYIAGGEVVGEPGENDDDAMRHELTSAINRFLDGENGAGQFNIKTFAESVHEIRNKYVAYEIGKAAEYNDANDSKNINGDSHESSPLKSQWFSKKPGDWIPSFNGTNEFVPGRLASNNQQKSAPKTQAKKSAESTFDTVHASYKPQVLRDNWIAKLQKYASSWSFSRNHRGRVKEAISGLQKLGDNCAVNDVDEKLAELKAVAGQAGLNAKGSLAKILKSGSFFYKPVAQNDGVQQGPGQNTTPVNGG